MDWTVSMALQCICLVNFPHVRPPCILYARDCSQDLRDADGDHLVELPRNYLAVVEGLIRKQRSESAALQGWLGPTRFSGGEGNCRVGEGPCFCPVGNSSPSSASSIPTVPLCLEIKIVSRD